MTILRFVFSVLAVFIASTASASVADGGVEAQIDQLLPKMTLDEKVSLVSGDGMQTHAILRLGIPAIKMADGPLGVRNGRTTAFPAGVALASSFDPNLALQMSVAIADEARTKGINMMLGPCVNMTRSPLGGRNFEAYGEDPYLSSQFAREYITGMQSRNILATVKHFAVNDQETNRHTVDVHVDPRALFEIHLPAFKAAVDAGAWSVMTAFNRVNGTFAAENSYLLTDILKHMWNFQGFVISDWAAARSTAPSANAGLDLEMPIGIFYGARLTAAVQNGQVSMATIDDKVRRILRSMFAIGLMQPSQAKAVPAPLGPESAEHQALAQKIAEEGIVLLKNENILPLKNLHSLAVIGPNASTLRTGGGGSSLVSPYVAVSPLQALQTTLGSAVKINFATGSEIGSKAWPQIAPPYLRNLSAQYFAATDLTGAPFLTRAESSIGLIVGPRAPRATYGVRFSATLVAPVTGKYKFSTTNLRSARVVVDSRQILSVRVGDNNAKQEAQIDLVANQSYRFVVESAHANGDAEEPLYVRWEVPHQDPNPNLQAQAVAAARNSQAVVIFAGLTNDMEGEGNDRETLALPDVQVALIKQVASANPNTIVVLNSGTPITMQPWLKQVKAVVQAWYPGQAGGLALARILTGQTNPSGKLPVSFIRDWKDSSAFGKYPGTNGVVNYSEGIFVGYRHLDRENVVPEFPFGFGLSYTTFALRNLQIDSVDSTAAQPNVHVKVDVKNTGAVAGAEVVQVYVGEDSPSVERPVRELKGFSRVELQPGETKTIELVLDHSAFAYFDVATMSWKADPNEFTISVGTSSRDLPLSASVRLNEVARTIR